MRILDELKSVIQKEDWLTIFKDSKVQLNEVPSIKKVSYASKIRKSLVEKWIFKKEDNIFIFTKNYTFPSPSTATMVILWRPTNWWKDWKDKNNKTMDEKIRKKI